MQQVPNYFSSFPIPNGYFLIVSVLLIIGGTFSIIVREELRTTEAVGLLLLVWLLPVIGVISAMLYLWLAARRHRS